MELMQEKVQKLTRTTCPRRPAVVKGGELSHVVAPEREGRSPSTGNLTASVDCAFAHPAMPSWAAAMVISALPRKRRRSVPITTGICFIPQRPEGRYLFLRFHELNYQRRNLVGFGIEGEVPCVENVNIGSGDVLAVAFRLAQIERKIVLAPDDQKPRLCLLHP